MTGQGDTAERRRAEPPGAVRVDRLVRLARGVLYSLIPAELLLLVLLLSGVPLPGPLVVVAEFLVATALGVELLAGYRLFRDARRAGTSRRAALWTVYDRLLPEPVRRIMSFDVKNLVSLALWVSGRRHGVPRGGTAVPYTGAQTGMTTVLLIVMVIELVAVEILLRGLGAPVALRTLLVVVEAYGILTVLAVVAAIVTRPHVITPDEVRIRYGAFFDLRVPRHLVGEARRIRRYDESGTIRVTGEQLAVAVGAQTNLLLELTAPMTAVRPLGRRAEVRTVRFFADDPAAALAALGSHLAGDTRADVGERTH
ncbi:hypothetical protein [Plantactinospora sonchi]|uniref:Integral membrane protein n=1 Tax=Plantactinospora sonchi TaxID=1544735 RepID=A0ABU7RV00_9ACTN